MDDELPPDWAIERAMELSSVQDTVDGIKHDGTVRDTIHLAFARYIATHEEPPVDGDLLIAREAEALACDEGGYPDMAIRTREGKRDDTDEVLIALRALKLAREKGVL